MKLTKAQRDYVKNWGRTALRNKEQQTIDMQKRGCIHVFWHPLDHDFVYRAQVSHRGKVYSSDCSCLREAGQWMHAKYTYLTSKMTLGMFIDDMLKKHKVSRSQMSLSLNISRMTLYQWIKDARRPTYENTKEIARYFADLEKVPVQNMYDAIDQLDS